MAIGKHAKIENPSLAKRITSMLVFVACIAAVSWGLRSFVIEPFEIPSASMEQTIQIGDRVFAEKLSNYFGNPQPGEIVTFESPEVAGRVLIKRLIATPGQTVDIKEGKLYIDGKVQDEAYTGGKPTEVLETAPGVSIKYPYTLKEREYWVMGDNRTNSADSRYFGPIERRSIFGHAVVCFWPLNRIHFY